MAKKLQPGVKIALDLAPIALFFVGYRFYGLMTGTMLLVAATLLCLGIIYAIERKVPWSPVITAVIVAIFGTATLLLKDDFYIKIKPTIINILFAIILIVGVVHFKKGLLQYLLGMALNLTEEGWRKLSLNWGFFFLFLAGLNEVIWRHFSTDFWVNFKVFGMMTLFFLFTLSQMPMVQKYMIEEKPKEGE